MLLRAFACFCDGLQPAGWGVPLDYNRRHLTYTPGCVSEKCRFVFDVVIVRISAYIPQSFLVCQFCFPESR